MEVSSYKGRGETERKPTSKELRVFLILVKVSEAVQGHLALLLWVCGGFVNHGKNLLWWQKQLPCDRKQGGAGSQCLLQGHAPGTQPPPTVLPHFLKSPHLPIVPEVNGDVSGMWIFEDH